MSARKKLPAYVLALVLALFLGPQRTTCQIVQVPLEFVNGSGAITSSTWAYAVDGQLWEDPDKLVFLEGPNAPWAIFKLAEPVLVEGFDICVRADGLKSHVGVPRRFKLYVSQTDTAASSFHVVLWDSVIYSAQPPAKRYLFHPTLARYIKLVVTPPVPNSYETLVRITEIALYKSIGPTLLRNNLTAGYTGTSYCDTLRVEGLPTGAWLEADGLPQGLNLDPFTGAVSGTPEQAFDSVFTVRARLGTEILAEFHPKLTLLDVPDLLVGIDPGKANQLILLPLRETVTGLTCGEPDPVEVTGLGHPLRIASNPRSPSLVVNGNGENLPGRVTTLDLATRSVKGRFDIPFSLRGLSVLGCDDYLALRDDRNFLFTTPLPSDGNLASPLLHGVFDFAQWPADSCTAFVLQRTSDGSAIWKLVLDQGEGFVVGPLLELADKDWARIAVTRENIWLTTYTDPPNRILRIPISAPDSRVEVKIPATVNRLLANPHQEVVYGAALEDYKTTSILYLTASDSVDTGWVEIGSYAKDFVFSPDYRHLVVLGGQDGGKIYTLDLDEQGLPTGAASLCRELLRYQFDDIASATALFEPAVLSLQTDGGTPGKPSQIFVKLDAKYPITGVAFTLKASPAWFDLDSTNVVIGPSYQGYNVKIVPQGKSRVRILIDSASPDSLSVLPTALSDPTVCGIVFRISDFAPYVGTALFTLDSVDVVSHDFDHKPRRLPVVLKDLPFELGTYSRGDLNRDGHVDLLDLFLSCDVIAEPSVHSIQDILRTDVNLNGQPDIQDLEGIRGEIISPSLPWPRDPNLPKRSPRESQLKQILVQFENRGETLDIVALKLRTPQDAQIQLRSVEEPGEQKAWLYKKQLRNGGLAIFAISKSGKLNPGSPYYKLVLNVETPLPVEQVAQTLQLAEIQAVTDRGDLTYPKVEISPAERAHILDDTPTLPPKLALKAYPNPFNASTRIAFSLNQATPTRVRIYDVRGRLVVSLLDATLPAGNHSIVWESTDQQGHPVPSGIYICRLEAGGEQRIRKVLLVR